jgi:hypothetical protein
LVLTAAILVIASVLVAGLVTSTSNSGVQDARVQSLPSDISALNNATLPSGNSTGSANSASSQWVICQGCGIAPNPPITLHSVASVEKELNITLVLPSSAAVSSISPSLKLLGVAFYGSQSQEQWQVGIFYSGNQSFVNGTSTIADLGSNGIAIDEVPAPLGVNESSAFAHDILTPGISKVCTIPKPGSNSSSTVQCQTSTDQSNYPNDYIVTQDGLSIVVNPGGSIQWADGRRGVGVGIESAGFVTGDAGLSVSQLLSLASTMTT